MEYSSCGYHEMNQNLDKLRGMQKLVFSAVQFNIWSEEMP